MLGTLSSASLIPPRQPCGISSYLRLMRSISYGESSVSAGRLGPFSELEREYHVEY